MLWKKLMVNFTLPVAREMDQNELDQNEEDPNEEDPNEEDPDEKDRDLNIIERKV
jgi:hypothetical protein